MLAKPKSSARPQPNKDGDTDEFNDNTGETEDQDKRQQNQMIKKLGRATNHKQQTNKNNERENEEYKRRLTNEDETDTQ